MRIHWVNMILGLCVGLHLLGAPLEDVAFSVGKVAESSVTGSLDGWGSQGFAVKVMTMDGAPREGADDLWADMVLGWNEKYLQIGVQVTDDVWVESKNPENLWKNDGLEIFVASDKGAKESIQLLVGPGIDAQYGETPRIHLLDKRDTKVPFDPLVAVSKQEHQYTVEVLLPWQGLGMEPAVGTELALQVYVNDADATNGRRTTARFFPLGETHRNTENMHTIRLAEQSGPPVLANASVSFPKMSYTEISILAAAECAGASAIVRPFMTQPVTLKAHAHWAEATVIQPLPDHEFAESVGQLELTAPGKSSVTKVQIPDFRQEREAFFMNAPLTKGYVFSSPELPRIDFESPGWMRTVTGPYTVTCTFYNRHYQPVTTAEEPGRYGAAVTFKSETLGIERTDWVTCFRTPGEINWRHWRSADWKNIPGMLPEAYGISPESIANRPTTYTDAIRWMVYDQLRESADGAIFLAGLYELDADAPDVARNDPHTLNGNWWFKLRKQLQDPKTEIRYLVNLPKSYDQDADKTWPLVLFLHGAGERGDNLDILRATNHIMKTYGDEDLPFILISPQCPKNEWWTTARVFDILDYIETKYNVDKSRLYLTGLSMGGFGTWHTAIAAPERFAAIAPICGGGDPSDAAQLKNIPVWAFHGGKDTVVPPEESEKMVTALKALGAPVHLTIYPDAGHNSWSAAYADRRLYSWLLSNQLGKPPVAPPEE